MRLEGTLDAFSLVDIFQLLSFTKKTGTLHLRSAGQPGSGHGMVHLREGAVTGARSDAGRQALGRRVVGTGLVDDTQLEQAVALVAEQPSLGLGRALLDGGALESDVLRALATEQATDAVFDLMRWTEGEFAFLVDESDPDDLGAVLPVEQVVAEGRRRMEQWPSLHTAVGSSDAVVSVVASPDDDPVLAREEWALLSLVDGRRTIADLVVLSGKGEYAVVSALAGLASRGLVRTQAEGPPDPSGHRQALLARLEDGQPAIPSQPNGSPLSAALTAALTAPPSAAPSEAMTEALTGALSEALTESPAHVPAGGPAAGFGAGAVAEDVTGAEAGAVAGAVAAHPDAAPVMPQRPEPFTPARRPDHPEEAPAYARASETGPGAAHTPTRPASSVGSVQGSAALQPAAAPYIERDPSVNKSLLLRLIAGVKGL